MFDKLKLRKAPLSLSSVSNAFKSYNLASLTPEISKKNLSLVAGDQYGLPNDSIVAAAFDPVQSLLAVSTTGNAVHVYGRNSVEVVFDIKTTGEILFLRFVKGVYLVCVEAQGNITVLSLYSKKILAAYLAPNSVTAVETDPSLDWLILGLTNGTILFYDVDRLHMTPMRIESLQKLVLPKQKMSPVLAIEWHPRDIGTLLVTYSYCAVQYLILQGGIKNVFVYTLTSDCRGFELSNKLEVGAKKKLFGSPKEVVPRMTQACYHPNGLHLVTAHADGTMAFWDSTTGALLEARTVQQRNLHRRGSPINWDAASNLTLKWVTGQDPELTLLIVCGALASSPNLIHIFEFGYTLKYSLTSHEKQSDFYAKPAEGERSIMVRFNRRLQERGGLEFILQVLPIVADRQPYFSGGHNPSSFLLLSNMGSLYRVSYRDSEPMPLLPPSLLLVAPPCTFSSVIAVKSIEWLGILPSKLSSAATNNTIVNGGAPTSRHFPRRLGFDDSYVDVLVSGHEDGTVRFLDVTDGDHQGEKQALQVNYKTALFNGVDSASYRVEYVSVSFESKLIVVGLANGNVALCKFSKPNGNNQTSPPKVDYLDCRLLHSNGDAAIVDLSQKVSGIFSQTTFSPNCLLKLENKEKISCLQICHAGFLAVGYKTGRLIVCDILRGPGIMLNEGSISKHLPSVSGDCFITSVEFTIMEYGQDGFSSLLMLVGTSAGGNFLVFKLVPQQNGTFATVFADKTLGLNYKSDGMGETGIDLIVPINAATGESAVATMENFQKLAKNILIHGFVLCTSKRDLRMLKLPKQKLAHKVVDDSCLCSGIIRIREKGCVLATITHSGFVKLFGLPALNDVADIKMPPPIYSKLRGSVNNGAGFKSCIMNSGDIFSWINSSEVMNIILYDDSKNKSYKEKPTDVLFNNTAIIPHRPSSSALLWAKGQTAYISSKDLALLIAGPNRKPAKFTESELAYNISPESNPNQTCAAYGGTFMNKNTANSPYSEPVRKSNHSNSSAFGSQDFMRSIRNGLDTMEETVNNYASGLSETMTEAVDSGKRSLYTLAIKSRFGF